MAFGNNRSAARPRSSFQVAGGTTIKYRHPFLSGQILNASPVDEVDVSRALKLNDTFLDANPAQDSSFQEVLVDGSTVTITNHLLNGDMNLQVLRTTGLVGNGDFIACLQLVQSSKDDIGGTLTVIENINGQRITTVFYGVSVKRVPHLKKAGNSLVIYPVSLLYSGWIQGASGSAALNEKAIWAVGNKSGLQGVYAPYALQTAENLNNFYGGAPLSAIGGLDAGDEDDATDIPPNVDNTAVLAGPFGNVSNGAGGPPTIENSLVES